MVDDFKDFMLDAELKIKTTGRNAFHSDNHRFPYEPTSYSVLNRLVESGYITADDVVMDYGCGLGRVPIYLSYRLGTKGFGIEFVKEFYKKALSNKKSYKKGSDIEFICGAAEECELPGEVTACFFFNPFDIGIMRGVMKKILESFEESPRCIKLFFYYPHDDYIAFLMSVPELSFVDEVDCIDLFKGGDIRNRIMVFEVGND